jgi:hypothetical protein
MTQVSASLARASTEQPAARPMLRVSAALCVLTHAETTIKHHHHGTDGLPLGVPLGYCMPGLNKWMARGVLANNAG